MIATLIIQAKDLTYNYMNFLNQSRSNLSYKHNCIALMWFHINNLRFRHSRKFRFPICHISDHIELRHF